MANAWLKDIAAGAAEGIEQVQNLLDKGYDLINDLHLKLQEADDFVLEFTVAEDGAVEEEFLLEQVLKSYDRYLRVVLDYDEEKRAAYVNHMRDAYSTWSDERLEYEMHLWDLWADEKDRENHL